MTRKLMIYSILKNLVLFLPAALLAETQFLTSDRNPRGL